MTNIDVTAAHIETVGRRIKGGAGPGGTDSPHWQDFLLRYGAHSEHLRDAVASLTRSISNDIVPWKRIRAMMANRLIALDKCPGVRPIGIGECLRRILCKSMILATGIDVEELCGSDQLCAGIKHGIEGSVHAMKELFDEHSEEGWGVLLVDAANAFNSVNRKCALYNARILWPRCSRFIFNTYRGYSPLIIRGTHEILYSKEGVTQGDPLSMLLYAIAIIPLIRSLKIASKIVQNWYADDASATGCLEDLKEWFQSLMNAGPLYGYHPEPHKSILIVSENFHDKAKTQFEELGISIVTGNRFLGGYIGDKAGKEEYVHNKVVKWVNSIERLGVISKSQPQAAYAALTKSLQNQWIYLQRVTSNCDELLVPIQNAIVKFLPALFGGDITDTEQHLFSLPTRIGGLGINNTTTTSKTMYDSSRDSSDIIVKSLKGEIEYHNGEHRIQIVQAKERTKIKQQQHHKEVLELINDKLDHKQKRSLEKVQTQKISSWLNVLPIAKDNFDLSPTEFRDALSIRYQRPMLNIPTQCDGCGETFSLQHALKCKKGGLVTQRHNEVRDAVGDLSSLVWKDIKREPIVREANDASDIPALVADLGMRGVWQPQSEALFDIRVVDTDAQSYLHRSPKSVMESAETSKKNKYNTACEARRATFTPFVASVDGILAKEAEIFIKRLADRLAIKWNKNYPDVIGWVRTRLTFAILRATNLCLRGSRTKWRCCIIADGAAIPQ